MPNLFDPTGASAGPAPHFGAPRVSGGGGDTGNLMQVDKNWTKRLPTLRRMGYDFQQHIQPIVSYDKQRVREGSTPLGNAEAMDLLKSVKSGHDPMLQSGQHHSDIFGIPGTSLLGNAVGDIQQITGGLFGLPGTLIKDTKDLVTKPQQGLRDIAQLLPGYTTATELSKGEYPQFAGQHPLMAALDILPYASEAGKVATLGIPAEEAGPIISALKDGQPLRAIARIPIIPGKGGAHLFYTPKKTFQRATGLRSPSELVHSTAQKYGLSSEIRGAMQAREEMLRAPKEELTQNMLSQIQELEHEYQNTAQQFYKDNGSRWHTFTDEQKTHLQDIASRRDQLYEEYHGYGLADWIAENVLRTIGQTPYQALADTRHAMTTGVYGEKTRYSPEFTKRQADRADKIKALSDQAVKAEQQLLLLQHSGFSKPEEIAKLKAEATKYRKAAGSLRGSDPLRQTGDNPTNLTFMATKVPLFGSKGYKHGFADNFGFTKEQRTYLKQMVHDIYGQDQLYVPRWFDNAFAKDEAFAERLKQQGFLNIFDSATTMFKFATLTGPRHLVHILASNLVFSMLEKPTLFFHPNTWIRTVDIMMHPEKWAQFMPGMPRGMQLYSRAGVGGGNPFAFWRTDWLASLSQGKSMGRIWTERYAGDIPRAFKTWENYTVDFFRAMVFVNEHDKVLKKGFTEDEATKAGQNLVNKVLMNSDNLTPVERSLIRRVIPFYPFTRQLLKYMGNYPEDHPWRAAVLSNIGRQEFGDQHTDLPWKMDSLFFLGSPDDKGNVTAIDMKNWNPFRSMEGNNPFTLAGFLSMMHPGLQALMQWSGGTPLSATPEMFPELTVDQYTGNLVAQHQDVAINALEQFIPPVNALDQIMGLSSKYKSLQTTSGKGSTDTWRKTLFSSLNIPFVPFNVNLKTEEAKFAAHWFSVSKQDLKNALAGDTTNLSRYRELPITTGTGFQSHSGFITPDNLEKLRTQLAQQGAI